MKFIVSQFDKNKIDKNKILTNDVYISSDYKNNYNYCKIEKYIYHVEYLNNISKNLIYINYIQRNDLNYEIGKEIEIEFININFEILTPIITFNISSMRTINQINIDYYEIINKLLSISNSIKYLIKNQHLLLKINNYNLNLEVKDFELLDETKNKFKNEYCMISKSTKIYFNIISPNLIISNNLEMNILNSKEWNAELMGIGGLNKEFNIILRRAFMSRMFDSQTIEKLGIQHVKGILLYGPPGCGKTLIARQIGKMISGVEPKIVEGPSILNKYVGESEKNIRDLFADAEEDQKKGNLGKLHVIIMDELDAICKKRGSKSDNTGVGDTIVNQLLSKIDGVNSLNNVLLIGMTNRKDMIDEALLRPGRFEIQIEIGLPDDEGRQQILNIHTKKLRENKKLDFEISELVKRTKNYTGAEIESLVRSAVSFGMADNIDPKTNKVINQDFKIKKEYFNKALDEIKPMFGIEQDLMNDLMNVHFENNEELKTNLFKFGYSDLENKNKNIIGIYGIKRIGKTTLALEFIKEYLNKYEYIKMIEFKNLIGYSEILKISMLCKWFEDAQKFNSSIILIDNIERIIGYIPSGPRFETNILSCILGLLDERVKNKLTVIITTSLTENELIELGINDLFNYKLEL